jgi:hypothetical protein
MEQCSPRPEMVLARVTIDILGPVPLAALRATAYLVRPGRRVEFLEAFLDYEGHLVMHASGWRVQAPSARPNVPETGNIPHSRNIRTTLLQFLSGSAVFLPRPSGVLCVAGTRGPKPRSPGRGCVIH